MNEWKMRKYSFCYIFRVSNSGLVLKECEALL